MKPIRPCNRRASPGTGRAGSTPDAPSTRVRRSLGAPARGGRSAGFTLIELLVVLAITAILLSLLLPSVSKVEAAAREAARKKLLDEQGISTKITDFPCVAPNCDFLQQGATFQYPLIPANLTAGGVLQSGLFVTYDANNLAQQPFALLASAPASGSTYDVSFDLRGAGVQGDDFSIVSDAYDSSIVEFLVRQTADDSLFEVAADVDQNPIAFVATQASIPEPATWSLVVGGFALMGFRDRRRRRGPAGRSRAISPQRRIG